MNLGQIRTRQRQKLDEDTASLWSDSELDNYTNETYRKLWEAMIDAGYRKTTKTTTLDLVANTREVALPSDFIRVQLLEHKVGEVYYPCRFYQRYDTVVGSSTAGAATYGDYYSFAYRFIGDNLILEPTPQSDETAGLRLDYYYLPEYLTDDSDTPDIPSLYHDLLVLGGVIQAKEKEEMIDGTGADAVPFIRDYNDLMAKFLNNINNMTQQRNYVEPFGY